MSELKQLAVVLVLVSAIGIGGVLFSLSIGWKGPLTVDYDAKIVLNGSITLQEEYVYHVHESKFRMLYRNWEVPMSFGWIDKPHVELLKVRGDGIPYAKDYLGRVKVWGDGNAEILAEELAERNEVGIIRLPKFEVGDYGAEYDFKIFPPIMTDGRFDHVNLKLADKHVPYDRVRIEVIDPNGDVIRLYPHFDCKIIRKGNTWILEGSSPSNSLVEVEMVLKHGSVKGFLIRTEDVLGKTESANFWYSLTSTTLKTMRYTITAIVLAFPALVAFVYYRYGREKEFVVPEFLSYVPKKRKPWMVNLVFKGDAFKFDSDGFYATLLDLQRRGFLEMETYEEGKLRKSKEMRIRVLKENGDEYERLVLSFIKRFSENGVFDTRRLKELAKRNPSVVASWLDSVMNYSNPRISEEFVENKGKTIFTLISAISILVVIASLIIGAMLERYPDASALPVLSATLFGQSLVCALTPSQLFGRWKGDSYKEKLEWDAFRRFLSDMAMIKKYAPEDVAIWKDWLVYGTALGVGENVVKAMKAMNVSVPEVTTFYGLHAFHGVRSAVARTSGGGGGGFGAGGGFGGGGAGGR